MADRQRATAIYLIDQFALRAGNEKGDDEAETVGCCSLKFEHITLKPPNEVIFDFLGKDSIRFYNKVKVEPQVFKNLKIFKKPPKREGDDIFDRLTVSENEGPFTIVANVFAPRLRLSTNTSRATCQASLRRCSVHTMLRLPWQPSCEI